MIQASNWYFFLGQYIPHCYSKALKILEIENCFHTLPLTPISTGDEKGALLLQYARLLMGLQAYSHAASCADCLIPDKSVDKRILGTIYYHQRRLDKAYQLLKESSAKIENGGKK